MGLSLPPFAASLATRLFESGGAKALTEGEKATKLASRLEELAGKSSLSAAEKAEKAELQKAVGELKDAGWKPKEGAAPKDRNESGFEAGKKGASSLTGMVDKVQDWVDNATLAGGVAGLGMTATGIGAPVGAAVTVASDVASLANAGVSVVRAGIDAATGDFAGAGAELLKAGGRALSAIPYLGTAGRLIKGGVEGAEVAAKVGGKAIATAGKGATLSEDAVKAFVKETADHPALTDLAYSMGGKFKGATLATIADAKGVQQIAETAEKIRKGETAGTTLSRYKKGEEGVNDFLQDVSASFSKSGGTKLSGEAVAAMGEDTAKLLGKPGAALSESVNAALSSGKLATKDLETLKKAAAVLDGTTNSIARDGIANAMNAALKSGSPGKALAAVIEKAGQLDKLGTKLSQASTDTLGFRQAYETLLDARITPKALEGALGNADLLKGLTSKAGFDKLVSEARRMSI